MQTKFQFCENILTNALNPGNYRTNKGERKRDHVLFGRAVAKKKKKNKTENQEEKN